MTFSLDEFICCPFCRASLRRAGDWFCQACGRHFKDKGGIPVLVDLENLPRHLQGQIDYFEKEKSTSGDYRIEPWQSRYVERFFDNVPDVREKIVVDCGTGSGYMAVELARAGAYVLACDLTLKSLVRLQSISKNLGLSDRLKCFACTSENIPLRDRVADLFISNAVLEHLPREADAVASINRTCRQGAQVMITVPLSYRYVSPLLLPLNIIHDKLIGHLRRYDEKSLVGLFPQWKLQRTYYTGHPAKVFKTVVNRFWGLFNEIKIEAADQERESVREGGSNIICFFSTHP